MIAHAVRGASPALLRRLNSQHVLRTIRERGPTSRADVAAATGLSKPTVKEVVELLLAAGYVRESAADGATPPRPGRRPRLLTFRADLAYVLGIDIGANKILALVADLNGDVLASERRRTPAAARGDTNALAGAVRATANRAMRAAGVPRDELQAVAVGAPGVVDRSTRKISLAPQLPGLEGIDLARRLGRSFDCPVHVENEVHLSVLAERWRGAAREIDDAIYVQIGVGIGGGILIGGELYRGASGAAGEIGYLPVGSGDGDGGAAAGGLGPFERSAGGGAFARLGRRAILAGSDGTLLRLADGDAAAVDAEVVFDAAASGDAGAAAVVDEVLDRLARGIAAVVCVLDPATVIVGGGVSKAGEPLRGPLERRLRELVPLAPKVVLSALGEEAVALGAVRRAVQAVDERLFAFAEAAR
jgi:predicted NBD/HSP70 family sugar kinase